jgi:hypothetical protein
MKKGRPFLERPGVRGAVWSGQARYQRRGGEHEGDGGASAEIGVGRSGLMRQLANLVR